MCSGKTTLGKALARCLDLPFIDLDLYIEETHGASVSQIFDEQGEVAFRRFEAEALQRIIADTMGRPAVIALGGGTPCLPGVMEKLNRHALTVWLNPTPQRIIDRLVLEGNTRPLIAGKSRAQIAEAVDGMLEIRNHFYAKAKTSFDSTYLENEKEIASSVEKFINDIVIPASKPKS